MAHESLKDAELPHVLSNVASNLADLIQKEMRLAKAEISAKLVARFRAGAWSVAAAFCGLTAVLLLVQALVFGIASYGIPLHWACVIVAAVVVAIGALAFAKARSEGQQGFSPDRTIHQIRRDVTAIKEQLT